MLSEKKYISNMYILLIYYANEGSHDLLKWLQLLTIDKTKSLQFTKYSLLSRRCIATLLNNLKINCFE